MKSGPEHILTLSLCPTQTTHVYALSRCFCLVWIDTESNWAEKYTIQLTNFQNSISRRPWQVLKPRLFLYNFNAFYQQNDSPQRSTSIFPGRSNYLVVAKSNGLSGWHTLHQIDTVPRAQGLHVNKFFK
ncbi:hypothetical protein K469DRAFT_52424 [Zopfia rhizophila CBS 207.26]|uniref:Uncharacterized protein n=1 Tax=Zopfia rhizophila CBS 207.26 TaxID=1314779 RepID=A0A6A6DC92_9PEZI|nr:hypothetical protein K469DRAFT_52424 [Zopfia rhizophila CBS 207.26]